MSSVLWPGGADPPRLAPHQRFAVDWVRDRLSRHAGAILADDVGLGKSWVAAAIAREYSRSGVEVELIVPASLVPMWRSVQKKFDLGATLRTHTAVRRSTRLERRPKLIVVDEAHRFRNPSTKGWRQLAKHLIGSRALFLTATPIWNAAADLLSLLQLLVADDELKPSGVASIELGLDDPVGRGRILDRLVLRRQQEAVPPELATGEIASRRIEYPVPESWNQLERALRSLTFPHCLRFSRPILPLLMIHRLHSSPEALRASLDRQLRFCRSALDLLRGGFRLERREFTRFLIADEGVQELLFPELFLETEDEPDAAELSCEIEAIESILGRIRRTPDPKEARLVELLTHETAPTLIFVGAVETARKLWRALLPSGRCAAATGSWSRSPSGHHSIGEIAREFQDGQTDLLITTDLGGEGLNLQRADRIVHYDLPWSPMRLEQRNGRAQRLGRNGRPLEVITFAPTGEPSPVWRTLERKRAEERLFWAIESSPPAMHPSFERLPSRITARMPQARSWEARPRTAERSMLLRRHPAGVELLLGAETSGSPESR